METVLIDVKEAAIIMGISYQILQSGLKDHLFALAQQYAAGVKNHTAM